MLVSPRLYTLSQVPDKGLRDVTAPGQAFSVTGWRHGAQDYRQARKMLLLHQTGSVKVGEVVRYAWDPGHTLEPWTDSEFADIPSPTLHPQTAYFPPQNISTSRSRTHLPSLCAQPIFTDPTHSMLPATLPPSIRTPSMSGQRRRASQNSNRT